MYTTDIMLYHCKPFSAHISKRACEKRHKHAQDKAGKARLSTNYEDGYLIDEKCVGCSGVSERGERRTVEACVPGEIQKTVKPVNYYLSQGGALHPKAKGRRFAALAN